MVVCIAMCMCLANPVLRGGRPPPKFAVWIFDRVASSSALITETDIPRVFKPLGYNTIRVFKAFRCNRHASLTCRTSVSCLRDFQTRSHRPPQTLKCPPNHQNLQKTNKSFYNSTLSYHNRMRMVYSCGDWTSMGPNYRPTLNFHLSNEKMGTIFITFGY